MGRGGGQDGEGGVDGVHGEDGENPPFDVVHRTSSGKYPPQSLERGSLLFLEVRLITLPLLIINITALMM